MLVTLKLGAPGPKNSPAYLCPNWNIASNNTKVEKSLGNSWPQYLWYVGRAWILKDIALTFIWKGIHMSLWTWFTSSASIYTLPEANIAPKNDGFEMFWIGISFSRCLFSGAVLVSGRVHWCFSVFFTHLLQYSGFFFGILGIMGAWSGRRDWDWILSDAMCGAMCQKIQKLGALDHVIMSYYILHIYYIFICVWPTKSSSE